MSAMADAISTELYSRGMPSAPRILVQPPTGGDNAIERLELGLPLIFPPEVTQALRKQYHSMTQPAWEYDRRYQAQQILPFLLVGPMSITKDAAWLRDTGITLAIGLKQGQGRVLDGALKRCQELGLDTHGIHVQDHHALTALFPDIFKLGTSHLLRCLHSNASLGKILIFCETGNEKSPAAAAAFVMGSHYDVDHIKAMQLCQLQRFCCNFDEASKSSLQSYWDLLCAQRNVEQARQSEVARPKRSFEQAYDNDDDACMDEDAERFTDRAAAPFV